MTKAKVTQEQADAYMDGWMARHDGQPIKDATELWDKTKAKHLKQHFIQGYEDCELGKLNFDKCMGPNDFEPQIA